MPADIALDGDYVSEWLRRKELMGLSGPKTLREYDQQIVNGAESPLFPVVPDLSSITQSVMRGCLERNSQHASATEGSE
jgi:hypothetical protein